jgi:hypothetical protein
MKLKKMNKANNLTQQMQPAQKTTDKILTRHNAMRIGPERPLIDYQQPMLFMRLRATSGFLAAQNAMNEIPRYDPCLDAF